MEHASRKIILTDGTVDKILWCCPGQSKNRAYSVWSSIRPRCQFSIILESLFHYLSSKFSPHMVKLISRDRDLKYSEIRSATPNLEFDNHPENPIIFIVGQSTADYRRVKSMVGKETVYGCLYRSSHKRALIPLSWGGVLTKLNPPTHKKWVSGHRTLRPNAHHRQPLTALDLLVFWRFRNP